MNIKSTASQENQAKVQLPQDNDGKKAMLMPGGTCSCCCAAVKR